jgi:membrane-bound lytic murein transglycosylase D
MVQRKISVKAGKKDTMASIAKQHRVTVEQIADWNKLSAHASLKPGQQLVLFVQVKSKGPGKGKAARSKKRK